MSSVTTKIHRHYWKQSFLEACLKALLVEIIKKLCSFGQRVVAKPLFSLKRPLFSNQSSFVKNHYVDWILNRDKWHFFWKGKITSYFLCLLLFPKQFVTASSSLKYWRYQTLSQFCPTPPRKASKPFGPFSSSIGRRNKSTWFESRELFYVWGRSL